MLKKWFFVPVEVVGRVWLECTLTGCTNLVDTKVLSRQNYRVWQILRPNRQRPNHFVQQLQTVFHFKCQLLEETFQFRGLVLGMRRWRCTSWPVYETNGPRYVTTPSTYTKILVKVIYVLINSVSTTPHEQNYLNVLKYLIAQLFDEVKPKENCLNGTDLLHTVGCYYILTENYTFN